MPKCAAMQIFDQALAGSGRKTDVPQHQDAVQFRTARDGG
jgi:hypothetical protein